MRVRGIGCALVLGGMVALAAASAEPQAAAPEFVGPNLVRNPGFEELNANGMPVAWRRYDNMGRAATDEDYFAVDTKTWKALPIGTGGNTGFIVQKGKVSSSAMQSDIPVESGASYQLSFDHMESLAFPRNLYLCLRQYDAEGKDITAKRYYFATNITPAVNWTSWRKQLTVLPGATRLSIIFAPGGPGMTWFDNIALRKLAATPK